MTQPLDKILSGEAMPESPETSVTENTSETGGEIQPGQTDSEANEQPEAQEAEAERERRRGSGAQLDAANERHRQELEQARREAKEEARRMFAAESSRLREAAVQEYIQKQQQQQPTIDQFDDFPGAARQVVKPEIDRVEQQARERHLEIARYTADFILGGADKREAVTVAFDTAVAEGKIPQAEAVRVLNSAVPWVEAEKVLKRQERLSDDYDQKLEAKFREKYGISEDSPSQQQPAPPQPRSAPVLPSNLAGARNTAPRSGPAWSGPASLQDIFDRARPSG